jgi:hypothetical protein
MSNDPGLKRMSANAMALAEYSAEGFTYKNDGVRIIKTHSTQVHADLEWI